VGKPKWRRAISFVPLASVALADSSIDFFFLVMTHDVILPEAIQFSLGHNSAGERGGPSAQSDQKCPQDDRGLSRFCLAY
jgi:hypothetical protein